MKPISIIVFMLVAAFHVEAADITPEQLPFDRIRKVLPEGWYIESAGGAATVSGWTKLSGSCGVCLVISRYPYDTTLRRTKAGSLAVNIPRVYLYVFPTDFEGRHVNTSAVFRQGQIIQSKSAAVANHATLIADKFVKVGDAYVFHNEPSYPDWETPAADVVKALEEVPHGPFTSTRSHARLADIIENEADE
jgi:hypothetical protein